MYVCVYIYIYIYICHTITVFAITLDITVYYSIAYHPLRSASTLRPGCED